MNPKVKLLQEATVAFRDLLEQHRSEDRDIEFMLHLLTPLFVDIMNDDVVPPQHYPFGSALGRENQLFYEPNSLFLSVESNFIAALED